MKPYSEACQRNQGPILGVLQQWFTSPGTVLEIGAGTGQHAVHFAGNLPHLEWQPTGAENLPGIGSWVDEAGLPNLHAPLRLDVRDAHWPLAEASYVFSANTAHIMRLARGQEAMFAGVGRVLHPKGIFCLYGPINRDGEFTSESNRAFDQSLRNRSLLTPRGPSITHSPFLSVSVSLTSWSREVPFP